jgi:hypothetical protein
MHWLQAQELEAGLEQALTAVLAQLAQVFCWSQPYSQLSQAFWAWVAYGVLVLLYVD